MLLFVVFDMSPENFEITFSTYNSTQGEIMDRLFNTVSLNGNTFYSQLYGY